MMDCTSSSLDDIREVFFAVMKAIDSPVSLGCWLRYTAGDHKSLAEKEVNPRDYICAQAFRKDYLAVSFLAKYKGLKTGVNLRAQAIRKFITSERSCQATNVRIRSGAFSNKNTEAVISAARRKIARLIGPFSFSKVLPECGWGPGASIGIPRKRAFVDTKMMKLPFSVSKRAILYGKAFIENDLHWSSALLGVDPSQISIGDFNLLYSNFDETNFARYDCVSKNAKTDRSILVEPTINGFLQKGVGGYVRRCLRRAGVTLRDQSWNQTLAALARDWELSTIDLKAASDSVSTELVRVLLDPDWFDYLDRLRSSNFKGREAHAKVRPLAKFSSMGNGFTFELESLIFWAITSSVIDMNHGRQTLAIYGDDIVCPRENADELVSILSDLGFTTNVQKTFLDGEFFESCGRHYFANCDVTPLYQKEVPNGLEESISLANRLIRYSVRHRVASESPCGFLEGPWRAAERRAAALASNVSTRWKRVPPRIPLGTEGDDALATPEGEHNIPYDKNRGYRCSVLKRVKKTLPGNPSALLADRLRRNSHRATAFLPHLDKPVKGPSDDVEVVTTRVVATTRFVHVTGNFLD